MSERIKKALLLRSARAARKQGDEGLARELFAMTIQTPEYFENQEPSKLTWIGGDLYARIDKFEDLAIHGIDDKRLFWADPIIFLNALSFFATHGEADRLIEPLRRSSDQKPGEKLYQPLLDVLKQV